MHKIFISYSFNLAMYTALGRRMTGKTNNLSQKDLTRRNKCLELKVVTKPEEEEKTYLH